MGTARVREKKDYAQTVEDVGQAPVALSRSDQEEIENLYKVIRGNKAKLVAPNGEAKLLPDSLHAFLVELIQLMSEGRSIYLIQNQAKLTTIQAAAMLGVSRQFLVGLLDREEIPYHMVGTHRRVYVKDLVVYKAKRDVSRKVALDELSRLEAEEGIYGIITEES